MGRCTHPTPPATPFECPTNTQRGWALAELQSINRHISGDGWVVCVCICACVYGRDGAWGGGALCLIRPLTQFLGGGPFLC